MVAIPMVIKWKSTQPSSDKCLLDPFSMLYRLFSICLLLQPSCAAYRSLNVVLSMCPQSKAAIPLSVMSPGKFLPVFKSQFQYSSPEKPSPTHSDRMRSLSLHICSTDSLFLGHDTFDLELQLLLIVTEPLLNSKQQPMYLCTLAYMILTITQGGLFSQYPPFHR